MEQTLREEDNALITELEISGAYKHGLWRVCLAGASLASTPRGLLHCYDEILRRGWLLTVVFLIALVLGPGPGTAMIDGTRESPNIWFGIPALYLWVVFCFLVMVTCILTAALTLWKDTD